MNAHSLFRKTLTVLSVAAACASAVPASAATTIILNRSLPPQFEVTGTQFDVDEQTGRVRLTFDIFDFTWESNIVRTESVDVPGLRFDRERREVLYESKGSVVTCARRKKILWGTSYPATDACRIVVKSELRNQAASPELRARTDGTDWVIELETEEPAKTAGHSR